MVGDQLALQIPLTIYKNVASYINCVHKDLKKNHLFNSKIYTM